MTVTPVITAPLPVLAHHVSNFPSPPASLVLVTHVLDTAVPYIHLISSTMDVASIVPIPYSTRESAREALDPHFTLHQAADPQEVPPVLWQAVKEALAASGGRPVVVQEIGGYFAPQLHNVSGTESFAGVVEDTKQGHWRYQSLRSLPCPVLSIAESPLKALENRQVGRAIAYSAERILRTRFFRILTEVRIGILGYGGVGEALTASLSAAGARVMVYDTAPVRMARASVDGIAAHDRATVLAKADLVLGVSGSRTITVDDVALLRDGAIIGSGSSKQVEIDVEGLEAVASDVVERDGVTELRVHGKQIFLLNRGMPINFAEQGVLGAVLDLVYTELYMCIRKLAMGGPGPGLHQLSPAEHEAIAAVWVGLHGREADEA